MHNTFTLLVHALAVCLRVCSKIVGTPVFLGRSKDYLYILLSAQANLRQKVTHSVQTEFSHYKRDNDTQVYLPR